MNIFFMRHGETDWNTVKRLQGSTDIPLNQNGEKLAQITADNMFAESIKFDLIFSSPLCRAQKTAQLMNSHSRAPILLDSRIKEFNFGIAEGELFSDLITLPKFGKLKNWFLDPENYQAEQGAESYEEFFGRIQSFLNEQILPLEKKYAPDTNILIVCHGGVVRGLCKILQNWDIKRFAETKIPNCGMNLFTLNNGIFKEVFTGKKYYSSGESDY